MRRLTPFLVGVLATLTCFYAPSLGQSNEGLCGSPSCTTHYHDYPPGAGDNPPGATPTYLSFTTSTYPNPTPPGPSSASGTSYLSSSYCISGDNPVQCSGVPSATSYDCGGEGPCNPILPTQTSSTTSSTNPPTTSVSGSPTTTQEITSTISNAPTTTVLADGTPLSDNACTKIPANSDVAGIGIRIGFYVLLCIILVIPRSQSSEPLLRSLSSILGLSGFAILLAAVIETARGRLTLYHAVIISSLLYFFWVVLLGSRSISFLLDDKRGFNAVRFAALSIISMLIMSGWLFAVWRDPRTFGPGAECNDELRMFFFGWRPPVVSSVRGFMLFMAVFLMVFALAALGGLFYLVNKQPAVLDEPAPDGLLGLLVRNIPKLYLIAIFVGIGLIEAYIKKNRHLLEADEDKWTFGQAVAAITVLGAVNQVFDHYVIGHHNDWSNGGGLVEQRERA